MRLGGIEFDAAMEMLGMLKAEIERAERLECVQLTLHQTLWDLDASNWVLHFSNANDPEQFRRVFPTANRQEFSRSKDQLCVEFFGARAFMTVPKPAARRMTSVAAEGGAA